MIFLLNFYYEVNQFWMKNSKILELIYSSRNLGKMKCCANRYWIFRLTPVELLAFLWSFSRFLPHVHFNCYDQKSRGILKMMAENEGKKKYKSGRNCAVVGCNSRQGRDETKFFHVVRKQYPLQGEAWVTAIARINPDGTPWQPSRFSLICGHHFIQGKPSTIVDSPDYIPTIFPTGHRKEATPNDIDRLERVRFNSLRDPWRS